MNTWTTQVKCHKYVCNCITTYSPFLCVYVLTDLHEHMCVYVCVYVCIYVNVYVCVCVCVCMCVYVYVVCVCL